MTLLKQFLSIPELYAIQWAYGAGMGIQLLLEVDELDLTMQALRPNGLWIGLLNVEIVEHGEATLKKTMQWI